MQQDLIETINGLFDDSNVKDDLLQSKFPPFFLSMALLEVIQDSRKIGILQIEQVIFSQTFRSEVLRAPWQPDKYSPFCILIL